MKFLWIKALLVVGLATPLAIAAYIEHGGPKLGPGYGHGHDGGGAPRNAPEVDPSMIIGGLSLLGGTLTVMRARRSK